MPDKLSPEGEVLAAHVTATTAGVQGPDLDLRTMRSLTHGEFQPHYVSAWRKCELPRSQLPSLCSTTC